MAIATPVKERLLNSIVIDDNDCWLWQRAIFRNGYARFKYAKTRFETVAHRVSYIEFVGAIPEGLQLDHLCRVRRCVNPEHLEAVTPRINTLRSDNPASLNARKTHCPKGHSYSGSNLVFKGTNRVCRICRNAEALARYYNNVQPKIKKRKK